MTNQTPVKWQPAFGISFSTTTNGRGELTGVQLARRRFEHSAENLMGRMDVPRRILEHLRNAEHKTVGVIGRYARIPSEYAHRICECQFATHIDDPPCLRSDCYGCGIELHNPFWEESRHLAKRAFGVGWGAGHVEFPFQAINTNSLVLYGVDRLTAHCQYLLAEELKTSRQWGDYTNAILLARSQAGIIDELYDAMAPFWVHVSPPTQSEMVEFLARRLRFDGIDGISTESLKALGDAVDWVPRRVDRVGLRLAVLGHHAITEEAIDDIRRYRSNPREPSLTVVDEYNGGGDGMF